MRQPDVELHMIGIHMADVMLDDHIIEIAERMGKRAVLCWFKSFHHPFCGVGVKDLKHMVELHLMFD